MKALVYRGPGLKALEARPKPKIQAPGDAIVRIVKTTICGTDLHILKGDVPTCKPGSLPQSLWQDADGHFRAGIDSGDARRRRMGLDRRLHDRDQGDGAQHLRLVQRRTAALRS